MIKDRLTDNLEMRISKLERAVFGKEGAVFNEVLLGTPASATQGTFTVAQMETIASDPKGTYIKWTKHAKDCVFRLYDDHTTEGYLVYAHMCDNYVMEYMHITISTRAFVLSERG